MLLLFECSQGRHFVALAQSLGPHLGYVIAPTLETLQPQIRSVAATLAAQQETRRRSVSCQLPPVEQLTVHDSAESLTSQLPSRFSPAGQQARQQRPPIPAGQSSQPSPRMLSPFQTYSAPAAAPSQTASPERQSSELQTQQQHSESGSGGSGRLDLSPAKTALDMSMLDVARLARGLPNRQPPAASEPVLSVPRRVSGEPVRRLSAGESETAAIVAEKADQVLRRNSRSTELELGLESKPSTEFFGPQEAVIAAGYKGPGKPQRRPPLPLMRASSPLAIHGPDSSSSSMPRQMSLHLPEPAGPSKRFQGERDLPHLSLGEPFSGAGSQRAPGQGPSAQQDTGITSPFANLASPEFSPDDDQSAAMIATTASSMLPEGSVINMASLLPPHPTQQSTFSPRRLSPLSVASLAAAVPQEISSSAAAALSAPMTALQPASHHTGLPGLTVPSMLPADDGMQSRSPTHQTGFTMSPAPYSEQQQRGNNQPGYRLPSQSTSLLLQLLPAGSAQSLTALMSRQASTASLQDGRPISRTSSLTNDGSTSVSVSSPKRSLLNMSRAVSEQLHLGQGNKGVQRPFLADLQQRWGGASGTSM